MIKKLQETVDKLHGCVALVRGARDKAGPFAVKVPNAVTVKAMKEIDRGEGKRFDTVEEMFKDLGI